MAEASDSNSAFRTSASRAILVPAFRTPTLGRIDRGEPLCFFLDEDRFEHPEIVQHLTVGEDSPAVYVLSNGEVTTMAHDPLPLHGFDRVEVVELRRPDIVDRISRRVIQSVGEPEVLADEHDRIATEETSEEMTEMRHGGPGWKRTTAATERPEDLIDLRRRYATNATRPCLPAPPG